MGQGTPSVVNRGAFGDLFTRFVDVVLDDDYDAGGTAVTAQQLGLGANGVIKAVYSVPYLSSALSKWVQVVYTGGALKVIDLSTGVEVVDNTDLSGITARLLVLGQGQG